MPLLDGQTGVFWLLALFVSSWAGWYLVKFTILPAWRPNEPKELPYLVPILGSAVAFQNDSHELMKKGRQYSQNRRPFSLVLGGQKFYVLTNPNDIAECYKNLTTLSFDLFVKELMLDCGSSKSCVENMCQEPPVYTDGTQFTALNRKRKSIARLAVDFHRTQLHPGEHSKLNDLATSLVHHIELSTSWENIQREKHYVLRQMAPGVEVSLRRLCGKILIEAATVSYFGEPFLMIDANLLDTFYKFDEGMWQLLYKYPRYFCKSTHDAKDRLIEVLTKHFKTPLAQRGKEAWFTTALEEEQRKIGLTEEEMASTVLIIYFALNANTYKWAFWTLSYLLHDTPLFEAVRNEIIKTLPNGKLEMQSLLTECPRLHSVLDEVLRLNSNSSSVRYILEDTIISGLKFRKGNRIMMPYRQLHEFEEVYGPNCTAFDPERFLKDKTLKRSACFKPFGGGSTWCPGRFAARQEVAAFIALIMHRVDISLTKRSDGTGQSFPRVDSAKPSFGMMGVMGNDDLIVRVSCR